MKQDHTQALARGPAIGDALVKSCLSVHLHPAAGEMKGSLIWPWAGE